MSEPQKLLRASAPSGESGGQDLRAIGTKGSARLFDVREYVYDWISARDLRLSCERTLSGFRCEWSERGSWDEPGTPKCYLSGMDESEWCGMCRQRNRMYPGLAPLRRSERNAFARMSRAARRLKREHDKGKQAV